MGIPILVVDDDPLSGGLSKELLIDAGFDAEHILDSLQALEAIQKKRFPAVILDILMPGMDGLTLCHKIKSDPALKGTKVVMVSGKSFEAEKKRAMQYGADLFIEKPYDVASFGEQIQALLNNPSAPRAPQPAPSPAPAPAPAPAVAPAPAPLPAAMTVRVWGTRSAPLSQPSRYGSRTPCVSVEVDGHALVLDAGSGIETLGAQPAPAGRALWLLLSHFHPAHVQGLARFARFSDPALRVHVCAASEPDKKLRTMLEEALRGSASQAVPLRAQFELHELLEKTYELAPGLRLTAFYANHPGATLGFIVQAKGRKLVYCPDSEIYGEPVRALQDYDEKLGKLCAGADLVIHDGRFTPQDYVANKNIGHSSFIAAVNCAARNGVKRLWLFHQDARYSDAELGAMEAEAAKLASSTNLTVELAREGGSLAL